MFKNRHISSFVALSHSLAMPAFAKAPQPKISHQSYQYKHATWVESCIDKFTKTTAASNKMPYIGSSEFNDRYNGTKDENTVSSGPIVELDPNSNHITIQFWEIQTDNPAHFIGTSAIILSASVDSDEIKQPYVSHVHGWGVTRQQIMDAKQGAQDELGSIRSCMKASYQNYLLNPGRSPS